MKIECNCANCKRAIELCAYWTPRGILCYECYVEQRADTLPPSFFDHDFKTFLPCRLERTSEETEQPNEHNT